jgi:hypothetical protein
MYHRNLTSRDSPLQKCLGLLQVHQFGCIHQIAPVSELATESQEIRQLAAGAAAIIHKMYESEALTRFDGARSTLSGSPKQMQMQLL